MNTFSKVYSFAEEKAKYMGKAVFLLGFSAIMSIIPYYAIYLMLLCLANGSLDASYSISAAALILLSFVLKNLANEYGLKASHRLAYDTLAGMRKKAADKLLHIPMGNVQRYGSGELKKIFVENIEMMELVLAHGIPEGVGNILGILVTMTAAFIADWRLTLCTLAVLPLGMAVIIMMGKNASQKLTQYYESSRSMNNHIVAYIRGMEVIKVFVQGDTSFAQYQRSIRDYKKFSLDWYHSCWKYMSVYSIILPATWLFVLPVGMMLYLSGSLTFAALVLSLLLALAVGPMFMRLVTFIPILPGLTEKYKHIAVLYEEPDIADGAIQSAPDNYTVTFDNVTFAYKETDVIKHMSFTAREGSVTAIVGESGAGKSTAARLLTRFWDVDDGCICLGGRDIRAYSMSALMGFVSYVAQDNFLFDTTIMENIRHGKPNAGDNEIIEIAKKAHCHDFITRLPSGYQTLVGEAGGRLSGGQRQRITIARAMLKNAPVVILDEATSSTDVENEDLIQAALNELLCGKTVIVIAHRLSTITSADNIIVLKQGEVTAQGTHEVLLNSSVDYLHMWNRYGLSSGWEYQTIRKEDSVC